MSGGDVPRTREEFRRFVLTHHPDRGGNPDTFAAGVTAWRQQSGPTAPVFFYRKRTILAQLLEQLRNLLPPPRRGAANERRAKR